MIVTDLDGKTHKLTFASNKNQPRRSFLCKKVLELLREIYPTMTPLEELSIPISAGKILFLDIYFPQLRLIVEVNGEQHYNYSSHFFKSRLDWYEALNNDKLKKEWAELNGIKFVELAYNETVKSWKEKIINNT